MYTEENFYQAEEKALERYFQQYDSVAHQALESNPDYQDLDSAAQDDSRGEWTRQHLGTPNFAESFRDGDKYDILGESEFCVWVYDIQADCEKIISWDEDILASSNEDSDEPEKTFQSPLTSSQPPVTLDSQQKTEEKQMTTLATKIELSPLQLAAQDIDCVDIIAEYLGKVSHDPKYTNELVFSINSYIEADGKDNNRSHDELAYLARKAKLVRVFKLTGIIKNSPAFKALEAKHTPTIKVSGESKGYTLIAVGKTAAEVANSKPVEKPTKAPKEKAPKKEKVAKTKPALPLPTIQDVAALEALDRKSLQQAIMAVNSQGISSGVNGKSSSEAIKTALAKEILGIEGYLSPAVTKEAKVAKAKKEKAPELPLPMPEGICWDEVKKMSYRQLQGFCKVLRSNGLFEGNVGGKGSGKDILLSKAKAAMRQLGHEIIEANLIPVNPDEAKPILERHGVKYNLLCQASALLAA